MMMATASGKYSTCVRRFRRELGVESVDIFQYHLDCESLVTFGKYLNPSSNSIRSQDGVISLNGVVPGANSLHRFQSNVPGKQGENILVIGQDGSLSSVHLPLLSARTPLSQETEDTLKANISWTISLKELLEAVGAQSQTAAPTVCILAAEGTSVSLLVGKHFCHLEVDSHHWKLDSSKTSAWLLSWECSRAQEEDIMQARLQKDCLFTLHPSGNISIFSVQHQKLVAHLNHKDFIHSLFSNAGILESQDAGSPCHFTITPDLQDIVVAYGNAKYGLYRINLAEYFSRNPGHLFPVERSQPRTPHLDNRKGKRQLDKDEDELDFTRGAKPVSEKGTPSNRSWWNNLDALKHKLSSQDGESSKSSSTAPTANATDNWQKWYLIATGQLSRFDQRHVHAGSRDRTKKGHVTGFQNKKSISSSTINKAGTPDSARDRSPRIETASDACLSTVVRVVKVFRGLPVQGVSATTTSALMWYGGSSQGPDRDNHGGLCFLDLVDNTVQFHSFPEITLVAFSENPTQPHTLLTNSEVRLLSIGMDQEAVVNKMMVYKSASVTEALCQLNNWDHCSIPIHALEIGLKHRQLDTIAFFLKSRENMFRLKQPKSGDAGLSWQQDAVSSSMSSASTSSTDATQLWLAMDLLARAISVNIRETQSKQYALQLLNLALNHLNKLIHNATNTLASSASSSASARTYDPSEHATPLGFMVITEGFEGTRSDLEEALKRLIGYTVNLRGHLKGAPRWLFMTEDETDAVGESASLSFYRVSHKSTEEILQSWNAMSPQEIIQSAIVKRQIPLAQAYLRRRQQHHQTPRDLTATSSTSKSEGLPLLIDSGLALVYTALLGSQTETAYAMLQNMGFNVTEELKKICVFTANTGLRDFLIHELNQSDDLTSEEKEMINFIHQLEHLYTCQSFEKAKALASERSRRHHSSSQPWLPPSDDESQKFLELMVRRGDITVSSEPANCENFNYGHVVLEWVRSWDQETRDRILLERILATRSKDPSISYYLDTDSAWRFLTSHHKWDQLKLWIRSSLALNATSSQSASPDPLNPCLEELSLYPGVVHKLGTCSADLREKIMDELSRHGIFTSTELASFDLLTRRLSSTGQLFRHPHPLGQRSETASITLSYKQWFLDMCIKKELPGLLYAFLDFYSLCLSENEVMSLQLPLAQCPWLEILLHFRWIGRQLTDPSLVFQASLSNTRLFLKVTQPTVSTLMDEGYPIIAIATLLYAPGSIQEALTPAANDEEKLWKLKADKLKRALRPYPKLMSAIFPPPSIDGVKLQDITVYRLLQGTAPFDPRKLFLWQSTNNVATPEDMISQMPYFSDPSLIERYAYTEAFCFTYYLRQGRPSFAYVTLLTSLLQEGATLTKKTLFHVYVKAYVTAVRNFTSISISAACTAFIEMLGRDSLSLRIDLETARTVSDHLKGQLSKGGRSGGKGQTGVGHEKSLKDKKESVDKEVVNLLMSCMKGSRLSSQAVLMKLEEAITSRIDQAHIDRVSWKAAEEWSLAVMFCRLHDITLTTSFPIACTQADNWLHLTCFVQSHQYPKQQVLDLVKSFRSSTIREHMSHALSNLQYGSAPSQDQATPSGGGANGRTKLPIKDYRTTYYTKMGFLRDMSGTATETSDEEDLSMSTETVRDDKTMAEDDQLEDIDLTDVPHELFEIVFECGSHPTPWKAFLAHSILLQQPVLSVIAACHQGANLLDCLCSWLYGTLSEEPSLENIIGPPSLLKNHSWSLEQLGQLIDVAIATERVKLLIKAFHIFDSKGVLNSFLEFCEDFLVHRDRSRCKIDLEFFNEAILTCRRRSGMRNQSDPNSPRPSIGHLEWYQQTANQVARTMLLACNSQWEVGFLLEVLTAVNFSRTVDASAPDYSQLYKIHKTLQGMGLNFDIKQMLSRGEDGTTMFEEECKALIDRLQEGKRFDQARELAQAAGLSTDQVVVQQIVSDLTQMIRSGIGATEVGRIAFWVKCNKMLNEAKVNPQTASQFFQTQVEETKQTGKKQPREKAVLLGLAYQWLSHHRSTVSEATLQSLEQEVWLWRLRAEVDKKRVRFEQATPLPCLETHAADWTPKSRGTKELLYVCGSLKEKKAAHQLQNQEEITALNEMIDSLLSKGCISQAHRLAAQFGHAHQDLSITLTCLQLLQGRLRPEDADPQLRSLVKSKTSKPQLARRQSNLSLLGPPSGVYGARKRQIGRSPSMANFEINLELSKPENDERLTLIEALAYHTSAGRSCCNHIINIYRISQVLDKPYDTLIKQVAFTTVRGVLQSSHPDRYLLAKDFIRANGLADNEGQLFSFFLEYVISVLDDLFNLFAVVNFLSDIILSALQQKLKKRRESSLSRPPASEGPSPERVEKVTFMSLAKLCKDPASLGSRLLEEATQLSQSEHSTTKPALTLEVELIVRAHDCYTLSCNMEGIASVLRASRDCSTALAQNEEYSLMVRLLIGVRRFSEMTYIFEILRANHQMEALLRKGAQDDKLKVALLDFLKRCDPPDTETYAIVALKFEMHREVASILEQDARQRMKALASRTIDNNIEIQNILENVLHDLTNAAKNYSKDKCLRHAERCIKQARLVALQIHLLPVRSKVINLTSKEVSKFVTQHPKFHEALIVHDGYSQRSEWSSALYNNVVLQGHFKYLEDFQTCMQLTTTHFNEVAARFRQLTNKNSLMVGHMQKFLSYCTDALTAYRIANQLEFRDIAVNLLKGDAGAYLSDVA